jgi:purine-cytosine permease-like protein
MIEAFAWLLRLALAALAFCVVWFGLPWLLKLAELEWPLAIVLLLAVIAALLVLGGAIYYAWPRRSPPRA